MRKILFSFFLFVLTFTESFAQSDSTSTSFFEDLRNNPTQVGPLFEVGYQKSTYASLGGIVGTGFGKTKHTSIGFGAVLDLFYDGNIATFGPRALVVLNVTDHIGLRFSAANYLQENNKISDTRIMLEIGYSFAGRFSVNVGLGLPVQPQPHAEVGNFRAGISINLAR
jgi:hypothetical protein